MGSARRADPTTSHSPIATVMTAIAASAGTYDEMGAHWDVQEHSPTFGSVPIGFWHRGREADGGINVKKR